jgi:hypothetical protein
MVEIGQYDVPWINNAQCDKLLGNPRPKTLQEIENNDYWREIFDQWITFIDAHGYAGVKDIYERWNADPKGAPRDELKAAGRFGDLRQHFYDDLGLVKAAERQWRQDSGAEAQMLADKLKDAGLIA